MVSLRSIYKYEDEMDKIEHGNKFIENIINMIKHHPLSVN
ncbi:hypothetical protein ECP02999172_5218 [Escherichia coli P0299917.2]|nr:hypothetical protein ECP029970676_5671 [Escherichia coli P02997067.6]ENC42091.1 hypothetical protein ECP02999172_5218 [Escherichia coli P0299917.2]